MKVHSTNYVDTFIVIADDCRATTGEIPPINEKSKSVANIQFEILRKNPYKFTSDDVLFQVFAERKDLTADELEKAREKFFSKGQACFRASPLTKRYGWGVHHDKNGKIAIFGCETEEYEKRLHDKNTKIVKAMKSSR
ncbi:hypothetical protein EMA8858_02431 [Emticicia aquatica]|jgi:hypothetical protein|uniref:Uncharacterized protein n=1 Tax=Emticicia aquatica TaxID=1681835 RepID=A0ABM9AS02_9BACT|nr:DUF6157 family protein [Emticicia aquatica]CAH0996300.1 hypothetical protein EMA8858_02431 [Emticicia aquatica]